MSFNAFDHQCMTRALALARKGLYTTHPNPRVGCVITRNGQVVGSGWHQKAGDAHAEIKALQEAGDKAVGGTAYVTLEPCVMCGGALNWSQLKRLVYGASDEKRGFKRCSPSILHPKTEIISGVLEDDCRQIVQKYKMKLK